MLDELLGSGVDAERPEVDSVEKAHLAAEACGSGWARSCEWRMKSR